MAIIPGTERLKTWIGEYDFDVEGGGQTAYVLRSNDGVIPKGSIIVGGTVIVTDGCDSGAGTMALHVEGANDIVTAVGQANWQVAQRDIIPDFTGSTAIKLTADRAPTLTIAGADFTDGAFHLVLYYV